MANGKLKTGFLHFLPFLFLVNNKSIRVVVVVVVNRKLAHTHTL